MREYGYTIVEHDLDEPWLVRSSEHRTVILEDGTSFFQ